MNKEWLKNKTVLVVGASSGVGKHLAFNLIIKHNCKIIAISNNQKEMEKYYEKLDEFQENFSYYIFDAMQEKNWQDFYSSLNSENQKIDVLINCVGELPKFNGHEKYTQKEITKAFNANFYSAIFSIRYIMPILKQSTTPAIINVSCLSSVVSIAGTSIYSASKSALKSYTEVLAQEVDDNFYVAFVLLGAIKSNFYNTQDPKVSKKILEGAMLPNVASKKIISQMERKNKRIVIGAKAKTLDSLARIFPTLSMSLLKKLLNKRKISLYNNKTN